LLRFNLWRPGSCLAAFFAILMTAWVSHADTTPDTAAKKKSHPVKKTPKSKTSKSTANKTPKKTPVRSARSKSQASPTPERYKEIQAALAAKGYLSPEQATGQWSDASSEALKRFQADQNIESTGRINSLSLIALGLGPKHEMPAMPTNSLTAPAPAAPDLSR
jgi:N-acetyl-anhydromuramyl-L-alanine amidase AmpD